MRAYAFLAVALATAPAAAAELTAGHALLLATLIAESDPDLSPLERNQIISLSASDENLGFPAGRHIFVKADKVICRAGNLDPDDHVCEISFPKQTVSLSAKAALALFAGIAGAGAPAGEMANSTYEIIHGLTCVITPSLIGHDWDAAATCAFSPGG